mmetsp:Transcript_52752/g.140763  ORF Transcript_52752/g.140763 Transcript_52752/m.140763 type:complete len:355 (+) Transcript_52752:1931-2995(+)
MILILYQGVLVLFLQPGIKVHTPSQGFHVHCLSHHDHSGALLLQPVDLNMFQLRVFRLLPFLQRAVQTVHRLLRQRGTLRVEIEAIRCARGVLEVSDVKETVTQLLLGVREHVRGEHITVHQHHMFREKDTDDEGQHEHENSTHSTGGNDDIVIVEFCLESCQAHQVVSMISIEVVEVTVAAMEDLQLPSSQNHSTELNEPHEEVHIRRHGEGVLTQQHGVHEDEHGRNEELNVLPCAVCTLKYGSEEEHDDAVRDDDAEHPPSAEGEVRERLVADCQLEESQRSDTGDNLAEPKHEHQQTLQMEAFGDTSQAPQSVSSAIERRECPPQGQERHEHTQVIRLQFVGVLVEVLKN